MLTVTDLGLKPYREVWDFQKRLQEELIASRELTDAEERLLLVEHHPVYTLGFHGCADNMLLSEEELARRGIDLVRIERGGDITFHGPGQLVAYPIIDLSRHGLRVKDYVTFLEETVIRTLGVYGIKGERVDGATGVWIGKDTQRERKICAIGVKCRRFTTMHGLALNVNTDLSYFNAINPCGFIDKGVTSIAAEIGNTLPMDEVKESLSRHFIELLH